MECSKNIIHSLFCHCNPLICGELYYNIEQILTVFGLRTSVLYSRHLDNLLLCMELQLIWLLLGNFPYTSF